MNIVVLNGSPKGDTSITMQYIEFIRRNYQRHKLQQVNVASQIKELEQDRSYFQSIISKVEKADGIIWGFPLYYFLVPSQYKRFIELIFERDKKEAFCNKYAASLSTSVRFYDHAAHNYINSICDDLGMKYIDKFSVDMYDLLKKKWQDALIIFADDFFAAIEQNRSIQSVYLPLSKRNFIYQPGDKITKVDIKDKKVLIIADTMDQNTNLGKMVSQIRKYLLGSIQVVDLNTVDIKGGCVGCLQCGYDNKCSYDTCDTFTNFFKNTIRSAGVLIYAATVKDRFISSTWKLFFDRCFFLGHIPSLEDKQIGFIISGPLREIPNLRQVLEAYVECTGANIAGFVSDEHERSEPLDALLQGFAERIMRFAHMNYKRPCTFLSMGGRKVLRDDVVWGRLRFVFQADHRYYKKHGLYDFPQRNLKARIVNVIMMLLTKIPVFRKYFTKNIRKKMLIPLEKILREIK